MPMNPQQLATGQQMPSQSPQAGPTIAPGQAQVGTDIKKILSVLGMAIDQTVNKQGDVDMNQLITIWPQIAQQGGINIPFQTVMQLIQQNPQLISDLIIQHGLAGIMMNGKQIPAEQLAGMGTGASVGTGG